MNGIIYYIYHIESGKGYIGRHFQYNLYARFKAHSKNKSVIGNAIRKYGPEAFKVVILDTGYSDRELYEKEILWIEKLGTIHPEGYNLHCGGQGSTGWKHTDITIKALKSLGPLRQDTKIKISKTLKEYFSLEENRIKVSESLKGRFLSEDYKKNISKGQKGHIVSEETRRKISEGNKGREKSPEECKAISIALTGGTLSEEHKANISASLKGSIPWNAGIEIGPFTREHIKNRVNSLRTITPEQVQAIRKENPYRGHIPWAKELGVTSAAIGKVRRYQAFPDEP